MKKALIVFLLLSSISALPAKAQEVIPGYRIRVTSSQCDLWNTEGTLVSLEKGLFKATVGRSRIECPVDALTVLEVSVGEREPWKATLVGFGIGFLVGVAGVSEIMPDGDNGFDALNGMGPAIMWGMASISVGVVIGHVIGRKRGTDRWERVPLPQVHPSVLLWGDGHLGIGFSIPLRR